MRRRLDNSSNANKDGVSDAKKRFGLIDGLAFGLPFVVVALVASWFGRPTEKNETPFDAALEVLESSTTDLRQDASVVDETVEPDEASESDGVVAVDEEISEVAGDLNGGTSIEDVEASTALDERSSSESLPFDEEAEDKLSVEEASRLLAQLEFQLTSVKKSDETDVETLLSTLATLRDEASAALENVPKETESRARRTFDNIQAFYQKLDANRAFFRRLEELDDASLDSDATRAFFDSVAQEFFTNDAENVGALNEYRRDFSRVASSLGALQGIERWNAFVEERGKPLERFYVSKRDADAALDFMRDYGASDGAPREIVAIVERERELEFAAQNEVATRRKILLRIESELAKKYWTYRSDDDSFYYLPTPPRVGANDYFANAQGELKSVDIPQDAPEISTDESPQKAFLRDLYARASKIQDETRATDVALWYREWCDVLTEIQRTDRLDPILQYAFFRDVAKILASSDYYFARRLEPLTRILNAPRLVDLSKIDVFRAEEDETRVLRATARARLAFLPKDHLKVDKTTDQLDSNAPSIAWSYRRVGWLDRNFADEWRCRRAENAPELVGELWVLIASTPTDREDGSASSSKARWVKVGYVDGRQATVNLIASDVPRGAIVFCRVRTDDVESVAKRSSVERIFRR